MSNRYAQPRSFRSFQISDSCGTVTVIDPFSEDDLIVQSVSVSPTDVFPDETVSVDVEIANGNPVPASCDVSVEVNGSVDDSTTVTISADSTEVVSMSAGPFSGMVGDVEICGVLESASAA